MAAAFTRAGYTLIEVRIDLEQSSIPTTQPRGLLTALRAQ